MITEMHTQGAGGWIHDFMALVYNRIVTPLALMKTCQFEPIEIFFGIHPSIENSEATLKGGYSPPSSCTVYSDPRVIPHMHV